MNHQPDQSHHILAPVAYPSSVFLRRKKEKMLWQLRWTKRSNEIGIAWGACVGEFGEFVHLPDTCFGADERQIRTSPEHLTHSACV